MKVAVIIGTRPEIIKMSPIIREILRCGIDFFILHTGQHYSQNLDDVFIKELELPIPKYNLGVGSGTHAEETAKILTGTDKVLLKEKPDMVLVEGDTNSVLAGALAAAKLGIKVGHVEAGLRSYDRSMPEELNRIVVDHLADHLYAPTEKGKDNLIGEGIPREKVFVTGNTIVDAVLHNIKAAQNQSQILNKLHLKQNEYFLATVHRQENVDVKKRLESILMGLQLLYDRFKFTVVYPIHPRTKRRIKEFEIEVPPDITLIDPAGYFDFLTLEANAYCILTDSGGIQEEACILHIPCVTLRDNTERPETIEVGSNTLASVEPKGILDSTERMISVERKWLNPFGDGKASTRIVKMISKIEKA